MLDIKKTAKNTAIAFLAQGTSMLLSAVLTIFVPKLLGVEEFGYWQLFIFYISYVGFFHFGLNDGVYLIKGGESREEIDKRSVNSQFILSLLMESLIAIAIVAICFIVSGPNNNRRFVLIATAIYLVVQNAASYFMFVLQAMNETRYSSYSTIVARLSFFFPLALFFFFSVDSFRPFVIAYTISAFLQFLYCAWYCKDILFSGFNGWNATIPEAFMSMRVGSKLMLANIASQLILGILRFAVDARWGVETFGKLSLSLSLVGFFLAFMTQAAMVLFPALRQSDESEVRGFFRTMRVVMGIIFPSIYLLYFPAIGILKVWLPAYAESLHYFVWLIPICVFESKMDITCTTLFKVRRKEGLLLKINVIVIAVCAAMVGVSIYVFDSVDMAIASTTIAIIGRSVCAEWIVAQDLEVPLDSISMQEILLTLAFILLTLTLPAIYAVLIYAALYAIFLCVNKKQVNTIIGLLRR